MAAKKPKEDETSSSSDEEEINETEIKEAVENSDEEYLRDLPPPFFAAGHTNDLNTSAVPEEQLHFPVQCTEDSDPTYPIGAANFFTRINPARHQEHDAGEGMRLAFALFILFIYLVLRQ